MNFSQEIELIEKKDSDWRRMYIEFNIDYFDELLTLAKKMHEHIKDLKMLMVCYQVYQTENDWIACSERLPEESDYYNLTFINQEMKKVVREVYYNKSLGWRIMGKAIAWMPLPEPYL